MGVISDNFFARKNELKWVGDGLENPRRMKRDSGKIRGFIPGTVNCASRIYYSRFVDFSRTSVAFLTV